VIGVRALVIGPLVAAILLTACAKVDNDPDEWIYDGPVNACGAGSGCAVGDCDTELGACVVSPPVGQTLLARVVPATGAPAQVYSVAVVGGTIGGAFPVQMPVTVTGRTIVGEGDDTSSLTGRVVLADVGNRLPGRPAQVTVYESYDSEVFDLELLPSAYDVIVIPEYPQSMYCPIYYLPPVTLDATGVFRDSGGDPKDVVVPRAAAYVKGQIRLADAPVVGLEMVAFDPETGRILSTVGETDGAVCEGSECGLFEIGLAKSLYEPGEEGSTFSLRASRPSEPHHPVFEAEGFIPPAAGETLKLIGDAAPAFGSLGVPVRFQATVVQPVRTQMGVDVFDTAPSCFVLFSSADVADGAVEKWVLTNESGELEETSGVTGVNLYPGAYAITVIPAGAPVGSTNDYAVYTSLEPLAITEDNVPGEVELSLDWRPMVAGQVSAGSLPVPTSVVSAHPAAGAPESARSNSAMSGGSGAFRFWLDEAPYIVVAEAPAESRYAWDVAEASVPVEALSLPLELPLPFVLRGAVEASADQVNPIDVAGSVVEWYREIDGRAYAVGRTVADEDGRFAALLPP